MSDRDRTWRRRSRWVAASMALAAAAPFGTASADTGGADEAGEPVEASGVFRIAYDIAAVERGGFSWDITQIRHGSGELALMQWVYGGLMRVEPDGTVVPDLAESVTVVDPGTVEIVMREGLTLHDGDPLDAEFVKWRLETNLAMNPDSQVFQPGFDDLEAVDVTGPRTLRLTIANGHAASWADTYPPRPEGVMMPEDAAFDLPSGAGPYRVVEYQPEQGAALEKNPAYWDADSIRIQRIEIVSATGAMAQAAALNAGQVDWALLDTHAMASVGDDFTVEVVPSADRVGGAWICKNREPFDDVRVRQALSLAIDREAINEAVYGGLGEPAADMWPVDSPYHNPDLTPQYDPEAAQQLLADAGLADGFSFDMMVGGTASVLQDVVVILQQQFAQIGVTANIVNSTNWVNDALFEVRYPVAWSQVITFPGYLGKLGASTGTDVYNICGYQNPVLDELGAEMFTVSGDSDRAVELWHAYNAEFAREVPNLLLVFAPNIYAWDSELLGDAVPVVPYPQSVPEVREIDVAG